ncbi:MAG TPA: hypothetical protein VFH87_03770 [Candidatus Udaeobacter sp.]|nr:hypothetical protein [Candidatus Udaeobacter sp.]
MLAIRSGFGNWILRYDAAVVFHIYIQVCTRNYAISQLQYFRKAICPKPMIGVIADVRLQYNFFFFSGLSATIDEVSDHMSNFSHMSVRRDVIAIRQYKSRKQRRIRLERILQIMERHANLYTCLGI